jgi:hypothetical protein
VLVGCGGGVASVSLAHSVNVTSSVDESPHEAAPEDVDTHLHETASYVADLDRLHVEITADGEHAEVLRQSAITALAATPHVTPETDGGDLELHVEVASVAVTSHGTDCKVKVFVLRTPQHDLLAIADGGATVTGPDSTQTCLAATSSAIIRDKLPIVFRRQLEAKQ